MITILADDLSGALDTGVIFQMRGARTQVWPEGPRLQALVEAKADVVVWNLNDRHLSSTRARSRAVEHVDPSDDLYMKVDSTLRGPVGAQIEAVLAAVPRYRSALLCPAFPKTGRSVLSGRLYVDQQPLERTALARDPENPMGSGDIAEILAGTTSLAIQKVRLEELSSMNDRAGIYVVDAQSDGDLDEIARFLDRHRHVLPVGSAGLARPLSACWVPQPSTPKTPQAFDRVDQVLALVGSLHPVARQQVAMAKAGGNWTVLEPEPGTVLYALISGATAVMLTTPTDRMAESHVALEAMAAFGAVYVKDSLAKDQRLAIVATGGDTALAFLRHLGVQMLRPRQEIAAGVVWSDAWVGDRTLAIITKSGAFGGPRFFESVQDVIQGMDPNSWPRSVTS